MQEGGARVGSARVAFSAQTTRGIDFSTGPATPITNVSITDASITTVGGPTTAGIRMSSNSTVSGLTISGTSVTGNRYGIYVANDGNTSTLTGLTIDDCAFINNSDYGVYAEEMSGAVVENSTFTGGGTGFFIFKFYASNATPISNVTIRNNQFSGFAGNAIGVQLLAMGLGTPGLTIEGNTITKDVSTQTSAAAAFVQLNPVQPNGQVDIVDNTITATGTFGAGTAVHGVQLRGNGPVSFTGNVIDGGNVGGSGTTPASSAIFIQSRSGSTIMPATTVITGSCNRLRGFHHGVSVFDSFTNVYGNLDPAATVSFVDNAIEDNATAQVANGATPTLDFENNWWGCAGSCDTTTGGVDTDPELTAPPVCIACNVDAECDDGDICNGTETCDLGTNQCVAGTTPCGDGVIQGVCGELCDDGNMTSNDGCSATCQPEFVCTPTPLVGCRTSESGKSQLQLKNRTPQTTKNQSQWKWGKGAITPKADFGSPLSATDYQFCVYANGALVSRAFLPAGGSCAGKPCWKENAKGFQYKDKEATPDGVTQLKLKEGTVAGKAQIQVKGKGANLDMPTLPLALPVLVQLRNSEGVCWESTHSAPVGKNDSVQYKDKND